VIGEKLTFGLVARQGATGGEITLSVDGGTNSLAANCVDVTGLTVRVPQSNMDKLVRFKSGATRCLVKASSEIKGAAVIPGGTHNGVEWVGPLPSIPVVSGTTFDFTSGDVFRAEQGSATTVTDFAGKVLGKRVTLLIDDDNTTIEHGSGIQLDGGVDFAATNGDRIEFIYDGANWNELSRVTI